MTCGSMRATPGPSSRRSKKRSTARVVSPGRGEQVPEQERDVLAPPVEFARASRALDGMCGPLYRATRGPGILRLASHFIIGENYDAQSNLRYETRSANERGRVWRSCLGSLCVFRCTMHSG